MATILVVDDELGIRDLLFEILNDEGHQVDLAENAAQARDYRLQHRPDLVLLDIWMPDTDGVSLLKEWAATQLLTMPVIMMSGHATIETAVEATRMGAHSFLEKPITLQKLMHAVDQGLQKLAPSKAPSSSASAPLGHAAPATAGGLAPALAPVPAPVHPHEARLQSFQLDLPLREARDAFEKAYFQYHLYHEAGSMTRVAERTGLERTHLYRKLKQLGVELIKGKRNP
jgi:DNA-binding NtrC family response regulator